MAAIFKREIRASFRGLTGYFFTAFVLLFCGVFVSALNLVSGAASFVDPIDNIFFLFVFMASISLLTMRVFAEERRQRTDQLLYSLPTTMSRVVLGKFFALLVVLLIPFAVMCCYPVILHQFGNMNLKTAYSILLAYYFMGAAYISIGMFISSLTESQIVAAALTFILLLGNYFLPALSNVGSGGVMGSFVALVVLVLVFGLIMWLLTRNLPISGAVALVLVAALVVLFIVKQEIFDGLFGKVTSALCLFSQLDGFANGVFDIPALVYFVAVCGIFLFLTIQSMEKRRWS